jgi:myo-inositol-1(or 4)-monophosphatase
MVGRPSRIIAEVFGEAIDASSVRGGFFVLNSSAFSLTRLVTGQLAAVIDPVARIVNNCPWAKPEFMKAGFGTIIGLFPYDYAAAALMAREAGCIVTDAYGRDLDAVRLLDSSERNIQSLVAACTPALHAEFMGVIERGMRRIERGHV